MADRGQSEVLGFVAVFGMIVLTITLVLTTGFVGLENERTFTQTNNAQRGMTVLAENVDDLARDGAESRTTVLGLSGASLSFGNATSVTVRGNSSAGAGENFTYSFDFRPVVYAVDGTPRIVYSGSALIRESPGGGTMVREPDLVLAEEGVVLPVVRTTPATGKTVGGSTSVRVRTVVENRTALRTSDAEYEIELNVTSDRADAWEEYLDSETDADCSRSGDTVSCSVTTDRVAVGVTDVRVAFE